MRNKIKNSIIICTLLVFCLTGCTQKEQKDVNEDEAELIFDSTVNHDEAVWQHNCKLLVSGLTEVDWVAGVEILPDSYTDYVKDNTVLIRITPAEGQEVTDQDRKNVSNYVMNSGCVEQFDIEYVE